jgi:hypothetical protein
VTIAWSLSRAVTVWPFAVYFSTAILALAAVATTFAKDALVAATMLGIATAAGSFVRPELAIPGMPLAAIVFVWSFARAKGFEAQRRAIGPQQTAMVAALREVAGVTRLRWLAAAGIPE